MIKKRFDQIYDLIAIRCIMETLAMFTLWFTFMVWRQCRGVSKITLRPSQWLPIYSHCLRTKDQLEIQIRTKEMHQVAEYGVAAHWAYKKGLKA